MGYLRHGNQLHACVDATSAVFWCHFSIMWSVGATRAADTMVGGAGALKKGGEGGNYRYL
jgi:hypothetical protein